MRDSNIAGDPWVERVADYRGQAAICTAAWPSTLGEHPMPQPQRRQVLKEWIDFFAEPTPVEHLTLWCRVNDELLRALRPQTQLKTLTLQWGPYTDLDVFSSFQELEQLDLGGASAITDIESLTNLSALTHLHVENARKLRDYSPLGKLTSLRFLAVDRGITGSRGDAESLEFVRALQSLEAFYWDPRVSSADFSPVLALTHATEISVTPMRGQTPSMADLEWALPGMQAYTQNGERSSRSRCSETASSPECSAGTWSATWRWSLPRKSTWTAVLGTPEDPG